MISTPEARRVRLTGRAARFVGMLQEFGHLDEQRLEQLYLALAEVAGTPREEPVDLPTVRRVAAAVLFGAGEEPSDTLVEDWPLLFS